MLYRLDFNLYISPALIKWWRHINYARGLSSNTYFITTVHTFMAKKYHKHYCALLIFYNLFIYISSSQLVRFVDEFNNDIMKNRIFCSFFKDYSVLLLNFSYEISWLYVIHNLHMGCSVEIRTIWFKPI